MACKTTPSAQRMMVRAIHSVFFSFLFLVMSGKIILAEQEYEINSIPSWVVPVHFEKPRSIPYKKIPLIIESINRCTAGRAKIEYPQEFREFLQKRLAK